jgi:thymidine kinase
MKGKKGKIEVICGPMFSGKTEELIRRIRRAQIAKQKVAIFKSVVDIRYTRKDIVSHNDTKIPSTLVKNSHELLERVHSMKPDVVGIDEAQFFDRELTAVCSVFADNGIRVIIAGLDQDYQTLPFGPVAELLVEAECVTKLSSICMKCGESASRTYREGDYKEQILVGATDKYKALCRDCYNNEGKK